MFGYTTNEESDTIPMILELENFMIRKNMKMDKKMKINILQTLHNYERKNVKKDILAGIIIMAVSIPISMGYAQIAGLPAVYGLYGSVFPILAFAFFSTSSQFIFGVDAAPAALIGAALLNLKERGIRFYMTEHISAVNEQLRQLGLGYLIEIGLPQSHWL